jgi:predicted acetyltransferase
MHDIRKNPLISPVPLAEKPIIARLLQLYMHDFSEFARAGDPNGDVYEDGAFRYRHLDSYWEEAGREPLSFRAEGKIAGFAFVSGWSASGLATDYSIAEFFVLRKYRRAGVGKRAAIEIISSRPGIWEIPVAQANRPALAFWRSVVASTDGFRVEEMAGDGRRWTGPIQRITPVANSP